MHVAFTTEVARWVGICHLLPTTCLQQQTMPQKTWSQEARRKTEWAVFSN